MCLNCIRADVDITEGIPKQATVHFCKGCDRYLSPPNIWVVAELESRELLALLLKKLKGLAKVRLIDAGFIWTEPHSKRIKVKLTIQKEVFASTILEQIFVIEFVVAGQYCEDCTRVDSQLTWKAVVQLRQKVLHKRTFIWLEQLILKHSVHRDTNNIKEYRDGLDFYYSNRNHAIKMVEFLQSVVPTKYKSSQELISSDIHAGTADFKFTYSVEIAPICKDDLVCLSKKTARTLSDIPQLVLCSRVNNMIQFVDPNTGKTGEMRSQAYWESPFLSLCDTKELVEFYVIDIQIESRTPKYCIALAEVSRANDFSTTYLVRTHLGYILKPGDHVKGYLIANSNFNQQEFDNLLQKGKEMPDIVLVRKSYPNARRKTRKRNWKLKNLVKEEDIELRKDRQRTERDYEAFLRDIEEDVELRGMINLYKDAQDDESNDNAMEDSGDETEEDFPEIDIEELLEDVEQMKLDE